MQLRIERILYKKGNQYDTLFINGYGVGDDGMPIDFSFKDGEKEIHADVYTINRQDVQAILAKPNIRLNSGFNIVIKNLSLTSELNIYGNGNLLKTYTQMELEYYKEENPIVFQIEHIGDMPGNHKLTLIYGWAFSLLDEKLSYKVMDAQGNEIKSTYRKLLREDLEDAGYVDHAHRFCGFQVLIDSKDAKDFTFLITDGQNQVSHNNVVEEPKNNIISSYARAFSLQRVKKAFIFLFKHGVSGFVERVKQGPGAPLDYYNQWFMAQQVTKKEWEKQKETVFKYNPKISILVPTYNTPMEFLEEMIQTVVQQSYPNWELCIADGSSNDTVIDYVRSCNDDRIKIKKLDQNYGIAGNTNQALSLATGDYIGLYDHDDILELDALFEIVKRLQEVRYDILYTDEDKLDNEQKVFVDPNFKPDFSEDLLMSHNYITHFFVVNKKIVDEIGGFSSEYDGAQDYDFILRCCEKTDSICHVSRVLYHWRMHALSTAEDPESKMYCYDAGKKAIEAHLERTGLKGKVEKLAKPWYGLYHTTLFPENNPLVSIVIPNKDEKETLKTCIRSLMEVNTYKNIEIIIIENNSTTKEIFEYYKELESKYSNIRVIYYEGEFNYSRINNFGVKETKGDYLLFLNNDTEMIEPTAIEQMLGYCMRDNVGIVGSKLLYADKTIQHAGVVVGFGGYAGHTFHGLDYKNPGFMMRPLITCNYSAVTAACLMSKKSCFDMVGGFDEDFRVAGNDIDYCLKVREKGYLVVYNAFSLWYHYESKTRGYEDTLEKVTRFDQEIERFQAKWSSIIENGDPYYNKNFYIQRAPYSLF